ncbi:hypothetical protein ACW7EJ_18475, partial [Acinetobacter soli]
FEERIEIVEYCGYREPLNADTEPIDIQKKAIDSSTAKILVHDSYKILVDGETSMRERHGLGIS